VDVFVAAGGDGTFSGVAGGLVHTEAAVGIVPLGTGNLLARDLGIPLNPQAALNLLTGAHTLQRIDAMQVDKNFFVLNVSVGLTGIMMRDTEREDKRRFGRAAYLWTGFRGLLGYQPHVFHIAIDGESSRVRASEVVIANSGAAGDPSLRWGPDVRLDDGQLDVHIIRTRSAIDYLRLAGAVLLGRQRQDPTIRHFIARESATVNDAPSLPVQGDGEFIGWPPVEVKMVPNAIQVVVPTEGEQELGFPDLLDLTS
jgi:diacylglycerol kinase family enzyme